MDENTKSAEQVELDREEAALRAEAESIDPARPEDATIHDDANPADARAAARESQPSPKAERTPSAKSEDATAATTKPNTSQTPNEKKPAETTTPPKAETTPEPSPFQKERIRLNETWKRVEQRKAELEERERQLAERERQLATAKPAETAPAKRPTIDGADAETWEQVAKDFEAEGNLRLAASAKANADKLREQEKATATPAAPRERFTAEEKQALQAEWQQNLQKAGKENPELMQEGTPLRKRVAELLQTVPLLSMRGDGILYAVEYAKNEARAAQAEALEKRVQELETEIKRLEKLTAIPSGGAATRTEARRFEELSLDEQERELRQQAAA